jgi:hypothetical protein
MTDRRADLAIAPSLVLLSSDPGVRLVSTSHDVVEHVGQAVYVRGVLLRRR